MDTEKLRQKILDLAIHGKLVPQDPNDEPASELLKRIHAERERLVKEGKLKKDKNNTSDKSHYEKVPFEIPKSWVWITLGEIGSWQSGSTPSRARKDYYGGNIPWLRTGDLNDNYVSDIPCKITDKAREELSLRINPEGSVLLAMYGATIGKAGILKTPATTNQACCACTNFVYINNEYLFYFLLASRQSFIQKGTGGAQPNISKEIIVSTSIPLPSLSEQRRIVLKLKYYLKILDNICSNLNDINFITKHIRSKILDLALNGLLTEQDSHDEPAIELLKKINPNFKPCDNSHYKKIPKGWSIVPLAEILDYEQPQPYIVDSENYSQDYSVPVLTAGKKCILGYTNEEYGICTKLPVILFDDFTTDSRYIDFPFKVKSSAVKILHAKQGINAIYVGYFMNITNLVSKTHKRYWISEYSKVCMPLPPRKEQNQIVNIVKMFFSQLDKLMQCAAN